MELSEKEGSSRLPAAHPQSRLFIQVVLVICSTVACNRQVGQPHIFLPAFNDLGGTFAFPKVGCLTYVAMTTNDGEIPSIKK